MGRMPYETLEEFWYGTIEPTEYNTNACKEYMTDEQKELFSRYTDAVRECQTMAECLLFQNSFKLDARTTLEGIEE